MVKILLSVTFYHIMQRQECQTLWEHMMFALFLFRQEKGEKKPT